MEIALPLIFFALLITSGIWVPLLLGVWGRQREAALRQSIDQQSAAVAHITVSNLRTPPAGTTGTLVMGNVVIAADRWRMIMAQWRSFFGGRVRSLEPAYELARATARVRMLEQANQHGATSVINVRLETSEMGGPKNVASEVLCYGTALVPQGR